MFRGRLSRSQFLIRLLACLALTAVLRGPGLLGLGTAGPHPEGWGWSYALGYLLMASLPLLLLMNFNFRRVQDIGLNGAWSLLPAALQMALLFTGREDAASAIALVFAVLLLVLPTGSALRLRRRPQQPTMPTSARSYSAATSGSHFGVQTGYFNDPTETRPTD